MTKRKINVIMIIRKEYDNMALIKCPECKKEVSDKSQNCIHCGCPIEKELICNECDKKINKDDKVCKNCGCPIEEKKEKKKIPNL